MKYQFGLSVLTTLIFSIVLLTDTAFGDVKLLSLQSLADIQDLVFQSEIRASGNATILGKAPVFEEARQASSPFGEGKLIHSITLSDEATVSLVEGVPGGIPYVFFSLSSSIIAETAVGQIRSPLTFITTLRLLRDGKTLRKPQPVGWLKDLLASRNDYVFLGSDSKSKKEIQAALKNGLQVLLNQIIDTAKEKRDLISVQVPDALKIKSFKSIPELSIHGDGTRNQVLIPGYSVKLLVGEPLP